MNGLLRPALVRLGRLSGLDLFVQSRCVVCGALRRCSDGSTQGAEESWRDLLCPDCLELVLSACPDPVRTCRLCGKLAPEGTSVCRSCSHEPAAWSHLAFFCYYRGPIRTLIKEFKFSGQLGHVRLMQHWALAAFVRAGRLNPDLTKPDMIVPVPLHGRRAAMRGYNQSLEMVRLLSRREGIALKPGALVRTRVTVPQAGLRRHDRLVNLAGVFAAKDDLVQGRHVLLADDVTTTGSTLREAAQALTRSGALSVRVLVLAVTPEKLEPGSGADP